MTTADAARLARVTVKGIQAAIHRGRLSAVKIGRDWQIDPASFDAWLSSPRKVGRPAKSAK